MTPFEGGPSAWWQSGGWKVVAIFTAGALVGAFSAIEVAPRAHTTFAAGAPSPASTEGGSTSEKAPVAAMKPAKGSSRGA